MVRSNGKADPTTDPAASNVLAAYQAATEARLPSADCYRAGVEAWRRVHPDHRPAYAGMQAVAVILSVKAPMLLRVE
jgi:hypothetical protein